MHFHESPKKPSTRRNIGRVSHILAWAGGRPWRSLKERLQILRVAHPCRFHKGADREVFLGLDSLGLPPTITHQLTRRTTWLGVPTRDARLRAPWHARREHTELGPTALLPRSRQSACLRKAICL